jgi:hypothetical protein
MRFAMSGYLDRAGFCYSAASWLWLAYHTCTRQLRVEVGRRGGENNQRQVSFVELKTFERGEHVVDVVEPRYQYRYRAVAKTRRLSRVSVSLTLGPVFAFLSSVINIRMVNCVVPCRGLEGAAGISLSSTLHFARLIVSSSRTSTSITVSPRAQPHSTH